MRSIFGVLLVADVIQGKKDAEEIAAGLELVFVGGGVRVCREETKICLVKGSSIAIVEDVKAHDPFQ